MVNNQMFQPWVQQSFYGVAPVAPIKTQFHQLLTEAEIEEMRKKKPALTFELSNEQYLAANCSHVDISKNRPSIVYSDKCDFEHDDHAQDMVHCYICGEHFHFVDILSGRYSLEYIKKVLDEFTDVVQTSKILLPNVPDKIARAIFPPVFTIIKSIPHIFEQGVEILSEIQNQMKMRGEPVVKNTPYDLYFQLFRNTGNPAQAMYMYNNGLGQFIAGANGQIAFQQTPQPVQYYDQNGRLLNQYGQPLTDPAGNQLYAQGYGPNVQNQQIIQTYQTAAPQPVVNQAQPAYTPGGNGQPLVMDYNAPVVSGMGSFPNGNAVGIVTPDNSVAGQPTKQQTVPVVPTDKPTVSKGFKG